MEHTRSTTRSVGAAVLATAFVALPCAPAHADDSPPPDDRITEYRTEAMVHEDGTVDVTETITYDFGDEDSPGISRNIPVVLDQEWNRERVVQVQDLEVSSLTGAETHLDFAGVEGEDFVVLVGREDDPDTHVKGEQTYELSYTLVGSLLAGDGHDEFYWNFVGPEWDVPIENVSVEVTAPEIIDFSCYRGFDGSEDPCTESGDDGGTARIEEPRLARSEIVTGAVSMPKGVVDTTDSVWQTRAHWVVGPLVIGLAVVVVAAVPLMLWHRIRSDRAARARFTEIPQGLGAATAHAVHRSTGGADSRDILVMLTQLEERGLVASQPHPTTPDDWVFHLRTDPQDPNMSAPEQELVRHLFAEGTGFDLATLAESPPRSLSGELGRKMYDEGDSLGLRSHPVAYALGRVLLPGVCAVAGVIIMFLGADFPAQGGVYVGLLLIAYAVASIAILGMGSFNANGRRVRELLGEAKRDTISGGPLSVAGSPSWELAVGLPSEEIDRLVASGHAQMRPAPPYFRDHHFLDRWDKGVREYTHPVSTSDSGSGFSSGGGFGGGSAGGGGGGGGGGRR